jgi:hypothetical protein
LVGVLVLDNAVFCPIAGDEGQNEGVKLRNLGLMRFLGVLAANRERNRELRTVNP